MMRYFCIDFSLLGDSTSFKLALYTSKASTEYIQYIIYAVNMDIYEG